MRVIHILKLKLDLKASSKTVYLEAKIRDPLSTYRYCTLKFDSRTEDWRVFNYTPSTKVEETIEDFTALKKFYNSKTKILKNIVDLASELEEKTS